MNIQASNSYILGRIHGADETPGGIKLPAGSEQQPYMAVLSVGELVHCCSVGDHVLIYPSVTPIAYRLADGTYVWFILDTAVIGKIVPSVSINELDAAQP